VKELLDKSNTKDVFLGLKTKVSFEKLFSDSLFPRKCHSIDSLPLYDKRIELPNDSILLLFKSKKRRFLK
jgi:hypothetical protein